MKIFEPITKEIDGITWNIEVHEDDNLPGEDHEVNAMYFKFASSNEECFTYKIRFPDTLIIDDIYGLQTSENRFEKGLKRAMILLRKGIFYDFISTRQKYGWKDKVHKGSLKKHSMFYKK